MRIIDPTLRGETYYMLARLIWCSGSGGPLLRGMVEVCCWGALGKIYSGQNCGNDRNC